MEKQEIKKEGKMTIDDLAVMMTKGFDGVNKKFDDVNKKFDDVNKKFDGVNKKIDKEIGDLAVMVANGFDRVDKKIDKEISEVKERLGKVEESIQSVRGSILDLGDRSVQRYEFEDLRTRFDSLEQKVK